VFQTPAAATDLCGRGSLDAVPYQLGLRRQSRSVRPAHRSRARHTRQRRGDSHRGHTAESRRPHPNPALLAFSECRWPCEPGEDRGPSRASRATYAAATDKRGRGSPNAVPNQCGLRLQSRSARPAHRSRRDTRAAGAVTRTEVIPPKVFARYASGLLAEKMARAGIEPATPRFSAVCSTD
jgi:hypothetical protein